MTKDKINKIKTSILLSRIDEIEKVFGIILNELEEKGSVESRINPKTKQKEWRIKK